MIEILLVVIIILQLLSFYKESYLKYKVEFWIRKWKEPKTEPEPERTFKG